MDLYVLLLFINKQLKHGFRIERVFSEICIVGRYHDLVDPCEILIPQKSEYMSPFSVNYIKNYLNPFTQLGPFTRY
jgi:hypothetical protein